MIVLRCPTFLVLASLEGLPGYVVHFETFKIFNESLHDVIVLEQHCFLSLVSLSNLSLDKLQVCVAS